MKASEIRELTEAEIRERVDAMRGELRTLKITHTISPVENANVIKAKRRDIARMLTVLRQKQTLN